MTDRKSKYDPESVPKRERSEDDYIAFARARRHIRNENMTFGLGLSIFLHLTGILVSLFVFGRAQANVDTSMQVFTVTLEGGEVLGGVGQAPKKGKENEKLKAGLKPEEVPEVDTSKKQPPPPPEAKKKEEPPPPKVKEEDTSSKTKELERTEMVDLAKEKLAQEKKEREKKEKEEKAKKEKERREKELQDKKKKEEERKKDEAKKKAEAERKEKEAKEKKEKERLKKIQEAKDRARREAEEEARQKKNRDKRLSDLARQIRTKEYSGESAMAGGEGYGAARLGGSAGGGGTQASYAIVAYQNELQAHVKSGWRWLTRSQRLKATVSVRIAEDGTIQEVRIEGSSGNSSFDDSVVRAVRKASPVPPPPAEHYGMFKNVRFSFDSHE